MRKTAKARVPMMLLAALAAALTLSAGTQQKPAAADDDVQTFRVDVDLVDLYFNVKDKKGRLIPDLKREDFEVYEDGRKQEIRHFSAESDQPLTLGLLVDTSVSQERVLQMEQEIGAAFLRDVLRPKDLAFLISFDVQVELLQDFTNSAGELRAALERTRINSGGNVGSLPGLGGGPIPPSSRGPRGTLLHDAVYLAGREKLAAEVGRKAMIILTDGVDAGSRMELNDAIEAAHKADAICYVLLVADRGFYGQFGYSGEGEMKKLTRETGGRMIEVGNKYEKIKRAFDEIAEELRTQYSIGYRPTNTTRDGSFRQVEIKAGKDRKVQHRRGYYAPRDRG